MRLSLRTPEPIYSSYPLKAPCSHCGEFGKADDITLICGNCGERHQATEAQLQQRDADLHLWRSVFGGKA